MKNKTAIEMEACGMGTFSEVAGTVYGFEILGGRCTIFDAAEDDEFREETFESAAAALDGFMVDGRPLGSYNPTLTPCLSV